MTLNLKEEDEKFTPKVVIRNGSGQSVGLKFSAVLRDSSGETLKKEVSVKPAKPATAAPYSVTPVDLEMETAQFDGLSFPLKGFLVVSATKVDDPSAKAPEVAPGTLPLTLTNVAPRSPLIKNTYGPVDTRSAILIIPFLISVVAVALAYVWFRRKNPKGRKYVRLVGKMSALATGLSFDPTKSWATLLTGAATAFNGFVVASIFPETRATFTQKDITILTLTFAGLLLASPAIYNAIRWRRPYVPEKHSNKGEDKPNKDKPVEPKMPTSDEEGALQGFVLTLLATSAGILGALLGQFFIVVLLINEIEGTYITAVGRWLLWILAYALMVYAILYVARGVISCLRAEAKWGLTLQESRKKLAQEIVELREQRRELEQKPRRTAAEMTKLRGIVEKLKAKHKEMKEQKEQKKAGTYRRPLRTL